MSQESVPIIRRRGKERKPLPTKAFLDECFDHDRADGVLIWRERPLGHFPNALAHSNWNKRFAGTEAGSKCCRPCGKRRYRDVGLKVAGAGKAYLYSVHLLIWLMLGNEIPENCEIDHWDGDPWNNREGNLRIATPEQNMRNRKASRTKKSKLPKCVFRDRTTFRVQVSAGGREFKKNFKSFEEACRVAEEKITEFHQEFANTKK